MFEVTVITKTVNETEKLDLEGNFRGTLTSWIVSGQSCPLAASIRSLDEGIKEVGQPRD